MTAAALVFLSRLTTWRDNNDDVPLQNIPRAHLTLVKGLRTVNDMSTLSTGEIFFKKFMDPDSRKSI